MHELSLALEVCRIAEAPKPPAIWYPLFYSSLALLVVLFLMIGYLIITGVGVWGVNTPVSWGFAIVNFVFWVGIGHAGTLISAILFLLRASWRTAIFRAAEASANFALATAGLYKGLTELKGTLDRWRGLTPGAQERDELAELLQAQAAALGQRVAEELESIAVVLDSDVPRVVARIAGLVELLPRYHLSRDHFCRVVNAGLDLRADADGPENRRSRAAHRLSLCLPRVCLRCRS